MTAVAGSDNQEDDMQGTHDNQVLRAAEHQERREEVHEPVPGPFLPGVAGRAEPVEWLTPQVAHPVPLPGGFEPERKAG